MSQGQADRVNYLMTRQAKVVAMTCTHAALKRRDFLDLAFKYDNLLLEEAAQILEIETFLPMLLQVSGIAMLERARCEEKTTRSPGCCMKYDQERFITLRMCLMIEICVFVMPLYLFAALMLSCGLPAARASWTSSDLTCALMQRPEGGHSRLKRVTLIGDHHQLPPVVKNMAFQKYSHLDQSLFTRFVRLGTPYLELNAQVCGQRRMARLRMHWQESQCLGISTHCT